MTYKRALVSFHWDHISTLTTFNKLVPAVPPRLAHLPNTMGYRVRYPTRKKIEVGIAEENGEIQHG